MLWWLLIILLVILLIASVPVYPYSRAWGYSPLGVIVAILLVLLLLVLFGVIDLNLGGAPATVPGGGGGPYGSPVPGSPSR